MDVVERARRRRDPDGAEAAVEAELAALLVAARPELGAAAGRAGGPAVILVVGVNGTGKTTTIGKLAARYTAEGRSVCSRPPTRSAPPRSTSSRSGPTGPACRSSPTRRAPIPGAVVYDALDAAIARGVDIVIADTAGRLHTKSNLMDELTKIRRIIDKRLPGAQPETLFVLDATTGQNGLAQARAFHEAVGLTGIVLTKLDSTAKGGIVFAIEARPRRPGPVRRGGGGGRRPAAVRPGRLRGGALRSSAGSSEAPLAAHGVRDRRPIGRPTSTAWLTRRLLRYPVPPDCVTDLGVARTRAPPVGFAVARADPPQESHASACSMRSVTACGRPSPT